MQKKAILFSTLLLSSITIIMVIIGTVIIDHIVQELNQELMTLKLSHVQHEISQGYQVLADADLLTVPYYVKATQEELIQWAQDFQFGETGAVYIFNFDNTLLVSSDNQISEETKARLMQDIVNGPSGLDDPLVTNQTHIWLRRPAGRWGWTVAATMTKEEARHHQMTYLMAITLSGLLVLIVATYKINLRFKNRIINRIQDSLSCVQKVEGHNLDARIDVSPIKDEITDLQLGINSMVTEIQQHRDHLEEQVAQRTQELHEAKEAAEEGFHAKTRFLANMSHELRTPLNAILGFSQLMARDEVLTVGQRDNLNIINRSGEHLLGLINEILDMSKIESSMITLNNSVFNIQALLYDVAEMFRIRTQDKGLSFSVEMGEDVPQFIEADEGKLRQILINLANNSMKFTNEGGIMMVVEKIETDTEPAKLYIDIRDTGVGIPSDRLEAVFKPFEQVQSSNIIEKGTGLGLAICKEYAKLMQGDLTVQSQLEKGTVFTLILPCQEGTSNVPLASTLPGKVMGLAPQHESIRILIAEDNPDNCNLLEQLLQGVGFQTRTVGDGQAAVKAWRQWQPDLIWMDIRMPKMNGLEAASAIRAETSGRQPVILALSASILTYDKQEILDQGCDDYVAKPFKEQDLFEKMAQYLDLQYVYSQNETEEPTSIPYESPDPEALMGLAQDWIEDLKQAAIAGDSSQLTQLLETVKATHAQLYHALNGLVNDYEFDEITTLMEQAMSLSASS